MAGATALAILLSTNKPIYMTAKKGSTFTILVTVFLIYGCCKAECIHKTLFISFRKIRAADTDSVSFISYAKGTGFSRKIDSSFIHTPVAVSDTSYSSLYRQFYADYDWKIINHSLRTEYRFNNFVVDKVYCCGEKAYVVRAFMMNNIKQTGDFLELQ
jgi:hypothetical protein